MIAESGASARSIRRAIATRPLWPEQPLAQARRLRRRLDPAVDRLGRHHEDGRTGISAEMPEHVQGGHGPVGYDITSPSPV